MSEVHTHAQRIAAGTFFSRQPNAISIDESIDGMLTDNISTLHERGHAATQTLQSLMRLGLEIGLLFQKGSVFQAAAAKLRDAGQLGFAAYLERTRREWSQGLMSAEWRIPTRAACHSPASIGRLRTTPSASCFQRWAACQSMSTAEDMIAFATSLRMTAPMLPIETAVDRRDPRNVRRFTRGLSGHSPAWVLKYEANSTRL